MKSMFFRFLSISILFLYGYSQVISQESLNYFSANHPIDSFCNSSKKSNDSQIYSNHSTLKLHDEKVKAEDVESEDDSSEQSTKSRNKHCYFKNFYTTHSSGNFFFYLKNYLHFFKETPQIFTFKRSVLFQVFRI